MPNVVWLLGAASFFNDVSSEAIFPLLGVFIASLGASMRTVGLIEGAADAVGAAIRLLAGRLSDGRPRRPFVITGYGIPAVARLVIAVAAQPWQVLGARLFDRFGKGIRSAPRDALLADAVEPRDRGRAFGLNRSLDHLGAAVGPLIASLCLAAGLSLRATFAVAAGLGVLAPLLLAWRLKDARPQGNAPTTPVTAATPTAKGSSEHTDPATNASEAHKRFRSTAAFMAVLGMFALAASSDAFLLLWARELGWSTVSLPLLWLVHHLVKSAATAAGGALCTRWHPVMLLAAGWATYALAYAGFAAATQPWHIAGLLVFYGLYFGFAEAPTRMLVADLAPSDRRATTFGVYYAVVGGAALPASLITGWLWDHYGARVAFNVSAVGAAVALILLVAWAIGMRSRRLHITTSA